VVVTPANPSPDTAVVMLHGFAGNFAVYCWQMARSARAISARTVCPSVGPKGDWWSADGARTLERTLVWLKGQGIRHVYLAGLSNGAVGAQVLASRPMPPGMELRGLVLISGAESRAPAPAVPVLFVQGTRDTMMPARIARNVGARLGRRATWFELDSGHFAFLDHHEDCEAAITAWLRQRDSR
jgi:pimeloyl-ACP methyl ester carboxylesterase